MDETYNFLEDETLLDNFTDDEAKEALKWLEDMAKKSPERLTEAITLVRWINSLKKEKKETTSDQKET